MAASNMPTGSEVRLIYSEPTPLQMASWAKLWEILLAPDMTRPHPAGDDHLGSRRVRGTVTPENNKIGSEATDRIAGLTYV
jgi:hypothetical protein